MLILYRTLAMYLTPLFILTTLVFATLSAYRGEMILELQTAALEEKEQVINIVIEKLEVPNKIGEDHAKAQTQIIREQREVIKEIDRIEIPVLNPNCFSDDGMRLYNETFSKYTTPKANATSEPVTGM